MVLSDEEVMGDLYECPDKERAIDISGVEVSDTDKKVTYSIRHKANKREVGFKRLKEIYEETREVKLRYWVSL